MSVCQRNENRQLHTVLFRTVRPLYEFQNSAEKRKVSANTGLKNKENLKIFDLVFMGDGDPVYFFASDHLIADDDKIAECYFYYLKYGETPTYTDMEKESGEFADESEGRDVE